MRNFRAHAGFRLADKGEAYEQLRPGLLSFRSEGTVYVYLLQVDETAKKQNSELLIGYGEAPFEVQMPKGNFRIACENRVWMRTLGRDQVTTSSSDIVFTTLDRPAPLSPEMAAIARLVRQNEIDREEMRSRFEQTQQDNAELRQQRSGGANSLVVDEASEEEPGAGRKPPRGKKAAPRRKDTAAGKAAEEPGGDGGEGDDDSED